MFALLVIFLFISECLSFSSPKKSQNLRPSFSRNLKGMPNKKVSYSGSGNLGGAVFLYNSVYQKGNFLGKYSFLLLIRCFHDCYLKF